MRLLGVGVANLLGREAKAEAPDEPGVAAGSDAAADSLQLQFG